MTRGKQPIDIWMSIGRCTSTVSHHDVATLPVPNVFIILTTSTDVRMNKKRMNGVFWLLHLSNDIENVFLQVVSNIRKQYALTLLDVFAIGQNTLTRVIQQGMTTNNTMNVTQTISSINDGHVLVEILAKIT
jgi:hypothetical protein